MPSSIPSTKRLLKFREFKLATSSLFFKSPVSIKTPGTGEVFVALEESTPRDFDFFSVIPLN